MENNKNITGVEIVTYFILGCIFWIYVINIFL